MSYPRTEVVYQRVDGTEYVVTDPVQGAAIQPADWQATDDEVQYDVWIRTHLSENSVHNSAKNRVTLYSAATGGSVTTIDVGGVPHRVHTFSSNGDFVLRYPRTVEHLLVAGGGGGGSRHGGGGGAGGVLSDSNTRSANTYPIVVGTGGKGRDSTEAANGGDSTAFGLTAVGGGRGGSGGSRGNADSGGSGGGSQSSTGSAGTSSQGNAGGDGQGSPNWSGGGGGGAGGSGGNGSGTVAAGNLSGGTGGSGVASTITGASVTYGGGGGGSMQYNLSTTSGTGGIGGSGGGGTGGHLGWELFDTLVSNRWEIYNTSGVAVNGSTSNHPSSRAQLDALISASTRVHEGRRSSSSLALLDWQNINDLKTATGVSTLDGNDFAFVFYASFIPQETKTYEFTLSSDDSADLFLTTNSTFSGVDPVVSHYGGRGVSALGTTNGSIALTAGTIYRMRVRQHERSGGEGLRVYWRTAGTSDNWLQNTAEVPVIPSHPADASEFDTLLSNSTRTAIGSGVITTQTGTNTANLLNWTQSSRGTVFSGVSFPNGGERFALRIVGTFVPSETGTYRFTIAGDDAVDLSIDGTVVTSHYGAHGLGNLGVNTGTISMTAGRAYVLRVRHQEGDTDDGLRVFWRKPSQSSSSDWFQDTTELGVGSRGTDGLGGGGGAAGNADGNTGNDFDGGRGGNGVVILRYPARVTP